MKPLSVCFESLLDDDDIFFDSGNEKKLVEEWIKNNYSIYGKLTISGDLVVNCSRHVIVKNKSITNLTNGIFHWGNVGGYFDCSNCRNLKSLEGAPEIVRGNFYCDHCKNLKTLEGAPKMVRGYFDCSYCSELVSLEGAPEEAVGGFDYTGCDNLKSHEGTPKKS